MRISARGASLAAVGMILMAVGHVFGSLELLASGATAVTAVVGCVLVVATGGLATTWTPTRAAKAGSTTRPTGLVVRRRVPKMVRAGQVFDVQLTAENGDRRSALTLVDEHIGTDQRIRLGIAALPKLGRATTAYQPVMMLRGEQRVGPGVLRRGDWFGIAERVIGTIEATEVTVLPEAIDLAARADVLVSDLSRNGLASGRRDLSDERGDLRAYVSGDDLRRVHWRTSARLGALVIAPPAPPADAQTPGLFIDLRLAVHTPRSIEVALRVATELLLRQRTAPWTVLLHDDQRTTELRSVEDALHAIACYGQGPNNTTGRPATDHPRNPITVIVTGANGSARPAFLARRGADTTPPTFRCTEASAQLFESSQR